MTVNFVSETRLTVFKLWCSVAARPCPNNYLGYFWIQYFI